MDRGRPVLIAAASGRALAASARRGGFAPLVADRFGDLDTLAAAERHVLADLSRPVDGSKLMARLDEVAAGREPIGLVCGTGFEDRADLMTALAARWRLLGNSAGTVARLKDPIGFAALCRQAQVPHPRTSLTPPDKADGWLAKRVGGSGGWHVRATAGVGAAEDVYFQERVAGRAVSAALLGDGRAVIPLGFSEQWTAPTPHHPYRYGGAVRPAGLAHDVCAAMEAAITRITADVPLTGLASADFLVDGDAFHLLEINPRPGATFDLFEPDNGSLFALHVEACNGRLPARAPQLAEAMAGAILYAERAIASVPALDWPEWTADRPVAGSRIDKDQPVCSVFARAPAAQEARSLVERRCADIRARLGALS
jgi:predicted ATP-grasp superfamily ATP-dependent carboligase